MRPAPAPRALAVTLVTLALAYGVGYACRVFLVALLGEFGGSRSVLAGDATGSDALVLGIPAGAALVAAASVWASRGPRPAPG